MRDVSLTPGLGRSPGGGHGIPVQYSYLENPMDRGAWQATVHRFTKSQTRLKWLSTHTGKSFLQVCLQTLRRSFKNQKDWGVGSGCAEEGGWPKYEPTQYNTCKSLKIKLYVMIYHQCIGDNGGSERLLGFICFNFPEIAVKSEKQKNFNMEGWRGKVRVIGFMGPSGRPHVLGAVIAI